MSGAGMALTGIGGNVYIKLACTCWIMQKHIDDKGRILPLIGGNAVGSFISKVHLDSTMIDVLTDPYPLYSKGMDDIMEMLHTCIRGYAPNGLVDKMGARITASDLLKDKGFLESGIGPYILNTYCKMKKKDVHNRQDIDQCIKLLAILGKKFTEAGWVKGMPLYALIFPGVPGEVPPAVYNYVEGSLFVSAEKISYETFLSPVVDEAARIYAFSVHPEIKGFPPQIIDNVPELGGSSAMSWSVNEETLAMQWITKVTETTGDTIGMAHRREKKVQKSFVKKEIVTDGEKVKQTLSGAYTNLTRMTLVDKVGDADDVGDGGDT